MKISIVIPVYNVAPYIKDCLHSVMVQSWQDNLECILVDDCGTDNSMQLVEERLQTYNFLLPAIQASKLPEAIMSSFWIVTTRLRPTVSSGW